MKEAVWQNKNSRKLVERLIVEGNLMLETPAHFGNGESEDTVDMPLALDALEGRALLTGSSLAGALRNYLRERECGDGVTGSPQALHNLLFGYQDKEAGEQSLLIVCDALTDKPLVELRDGVTIDPVTRTAMDKKKFDFELLQAGTIFPLHIELLLTAEKHNDLRRALAVALQGLETGEIALGARKRRGLGHCKVSTWRVRSYDLTSAAGLSGWLADDRTQEKTGSQIASLLKAQDVNFDRRLHFTIEAEFALESSLLIRSNFGTPKAPDFSHLHSVRPGQVDEVPVISGTSLAGVLRGRAFRIANTLEVEDAQALVDEIFGPRIERSEDKPKASRLWVDECVIQTHRALQQERVQNRGKIDRFTGGAYPTALFNEQPFFPDQADRVHLRLHLRHPKKAHIGLLLLVFKDLWNGDLPVGGESSVGRGRLRGLNADLSYHLAEDDPQTWNFKSLDSQSLKITGDARRLEAFVTALTGGNDE